MNISNALKLGAAIVAVGATFYAAHRSLANKKAAVEKQVQVNKIEELIGDVYLAAKDNDYTLTEEDTTDINAFKALTNASDIVSLESAANILRCKVERISGKSAEVREVERKAVGSEVVALISLITTKSREKKFGLTKDQLNTMDSANIAVLANSSKGTLTDFQTQLEAIMAAVNAAE